MFVGKTEMTVEPRVAFLQLYLKQISILLRVLKVKKIKLKKLVFKNANCFCGFGGMKWNSRIFLKWQIATELIRIQIKDFCC